MKKTWTKKILSLIVVGIMCVCAPASIIQASEPIASSQGEITPFFSYIVVAYNSLVLNPLGRFTCKGDTHVDPPYVAAITVELQQYKNGSWTTIKSWYDSGSDYAAAYNDWYVASGYNYRLKNTHQALSGGRVLETFISYSDVKYY